MQFHDLKSIFHTSCELIGFSKYSNNKKIVLYMYLVYKATLCIIICSSTVFDIMLPHLSPHKFIYTCNNIVKLLNPIALRKAKIAYNFGLSECDRVKSG